MPGNLWGFLQASPLSVYWFTLSLRLSPMPSSIHWTDEQVQFLKENVPLYEIAQEQGPTATQEWQSNAINRFFCRFPLVEENAVIRQAKHNICKSVSGLSQSYIDHVLMAFLGYSKVL